MAVKTSAPEKEEELNTFSSMKESWKKGFYYPLFFIYAFCFTFLFIRDQLRRRKNCYFLLFHHHIFTINLLLIVRTFLSLVCKWGRKINSSFHPRKSFKNFSVCRRNVIRKSWAFLCSLALLHVYTRAKALGIQNDIISQPWRRCLLAQGDELWFFVDKTLVQELSGSFL